jgi:hypothetical protein
MVLFHISVLWEPLPLSGSSHCACVVGSLMFVPPVAGGGGGGVGGGGGGVEALAGP